MQTKRILFYIINGINIFLSAILNYSFLHNFYEEYWGMCGFVIILIKLCLLNLNYNHFKHLERFFLKWIKGEVILHSDYDGNVFLHFVTKKKEFLYSTLETLFLQCLVLIGVVPGEDPFCTSPNRSFLPLWAIQFYRRKLQW